MSDMSYYVKAGVTCDGTGCDSKVVGKPVSTFVEPYTAKAVADGWTVWVGRSRRHYCPACAPKPGHKMREITNRFRSVLAGQDGQR